MPDDFVARCTMLSKLNGNLEKNIGIAKNYFASILNCSTIEEAKKLAYSGYQSVKNPTEIKAQLASTSQIPPISLKENNPTKICTPEQIKNNQLLIKSNDSLKENNLPIDDPWSRSTPQKKPRKQRNDKGKKRGPYK